MSFEIGCGSFCVRDYRWRVGHSLHLVEYNWWSKSWWSKSWWSQPIFFSWPFYFKIGVVKQVSDLVELDHLVEHFFLMALLF